MVRMKYHCMYNTSHNGALISYNNNNNADKTVVLLTHGCGERRWYILSLYVPCKQMYNYFHVWFCSRGGIKNLNQIGICVENWRAENREVSRLLRPNTGGKISIWNAAFNDPKQTAPHSQKLRCPIRIWHLYQVIESMLDPLLRIDGKKNGKWGMSFFHKTKNPPVSLKSRETRLLCPSRFDYLFSSLSVCSCIW